MEFPWFLVPFPQTLSDQNINRGLVCALAHSVAQTQKVRRQNMATSMVGLENGHIRKNLTQAGEPHRRRGRQLWPSAPPSRTDNLTSRKDTLPAKQAQTATSITTTATSITTTATSITTAATSITTTAISITTTNNNSNINNNNSNINSNNNINNNNNSINKNNNIKSVYLRREVHVCERQNRWG